MCHRPCPCLGCNFACLGRLHFFFFPKKPAPKGAGGGEDYAMPLLDIALEAKSSKREEDGASPAGPEVGVEPNEPVIA